MAVEQANKAAVKRAMAKWQKKPCDSSRFVRGGI